MNKAPAIGSRVQLTKEFGGGMITGTVTKIRKTHLYDPDFDWDSDDPPTVIGIAPQSKWKATVKVDKKPPNWPYGETDLFCPDVAELQLITTLEGGR